MSSTPESVSVITIVRNHLDGLRNTYNSLVLQEGIAWEMIVVDGDSKDGTREFLSTLATKDQRVRVVDQVGLGIYAAMNQGIQESSTDYLWFMNAGDLFASSKVILDAYKILTLSGADLVIGKHSVQPNFECSINSREFKQMRMWKLMFTRNGTCHQSMLFRKATLLSVNSYDTSFRIASDFNTILAISQIGSIKSTKAIYASIEGDGFSDAHLYEMYEEKFNIRKHYAKSSFILRFMNLLWTILASSKYLARRW